MLEGAKKSRWLLETEKRVKEQILPEIQKVCISDDIFILAQQLQSCKVIHFLLCRKPPSLW